LFALTAPLPLIIVVVTVERNRGEDAGSNHALVQGAHDLAAFLGADYERAEHRGDDRQPAQHHRVDDRVRPERFGREAAEQHGGDQGHRIGLEQVGRHAGAVTDVVADVVRDHGRVARVVLRDAGFHLAHQVRTDVRALGEDAAAQSREDGDQRTAERQAHQRVQRGVLTQAQRLQRGVVARHAQQAQANHQHAGDRAAPKRHFQRGADAFACRLRSANVGAHGDEHPDVACQGGKHRANRKAHRGGPVQRRANHNEQNRAHQPDRAVLAVHVSFRTFLHGGSDLLHLLIARVLTQDPGRGQQAIDNGHDCRSQRQPERHLIGHCYSPRKSLKNSVVADHFQRPAPVEKARRGTGARQNRGMVPDFAAPCFPKFRKPELNQHPSAPARRTSGGPAPAASSQTSKSGSFFASKTFLSRTYLGSPSGPYGG
jgi:hypothetical protein